MQNLFQELKRRSVFRVAGIYAVAAWPLVQLADLFFPAFGLPDESMTYLLVAYVLGFPFALILSWVFNLTGKGIVLDSGEISDSKEPSHDWLIVGGLITLMLAFFAIFSMQTTPIATTAIGERSAVVEELNAVADVNSIAVLPFQIFSMDENDRYFADGLTDELSNAVSRIPGLRVAARTSTFTYLNSGKSIAEIGSELNVSKILEGTVRHNDVDNLIRVSASLVDVSSGSQLWSKSFEREFTDLFKVQEEIAEVVAKQMKLEFSSDEEDYAKTVPSSVDAMVAYSAGQSELQKRTVPTLKAALSWFQRAVELDPNYAPAHIGIANSASLLFLYGGSTEQQSVELSKPAIQRAMTIEPDSAEVYAAQGLVIWKENAGKASEFFKKAIAANANYASAHNWYGGVLRSLGKLEEALIYFEKAYQLDPRSTVSAQNVAQSLFDLARDKEALRVIDQIILMDPYYPGAFNLIGELYLKRGKLDAAVVQFRKSLELAPSNKAGAFGLFNATVELRDRVLAESAFETLKPLGDVDQGSEWSAILKLFDARKELTFGNMAAGIEKLEQALTAFEGKRQYNFISAEKGYFSGDYSQAIKSFRAIEQESEKLGVDIYSGDDGIGLHFAYALFQTGEQQAASEVLDKILKEVDKPWRKKRQYPDDFFMLAQIAIVKNKVDEALLYLNMAINAGWTSSWILEFDPAWQRLLDDERLISLKQRVETRLTSMRNSLASNDSFTQTTTASLLR